MIYDVIIVGAGPAGLFSAYILRNKKVLLLDKGKKPSARECPITNNQECLNCDPCNILAGIGGAGLFSDGKLNFTYKHGKTDLTEFVNVTEARKLIAESEKIFSQFGMTGKTYPTNKEKAITIKKRAKKVGIDLLLIKQKHLGSDNLPKYINKMMAFLEKSGVEILTELDVKKVLVKNDSFYAIQTSKGEFKAKKIILAPGRVGSKWLYDQAKKLGIKLRQRGIEVGVRVEVPREVMDPITDIIYDPPFFNYSDTYDDQVRTFCTNQGGFVSKENYFDFVCVNGYACKDRKSPNTNFALLSKVILTEPVTDNYAYGKSIGRLSTILGGGKPLIQRYVDLKKGRRSTWERIKKSYVEPTLSDVVPGDISMTLSKRIVTNLIETLEKLNRLMPGIASNSTLLYAPEIKFFSTQLYTNNNLETKIKGLFVAGDGAGVAGNIVGAAATGILASKEILRQLET